MPKNKISRAVRADAIVTLLIVASSDPHDLSCIVTRLADGDDEFRLALDAMMEVNAYGSYEESAMEAAALLEDGWSPGDEVVRL